MSSRDETMNPPGGGDASLNPAGVRTVPVTVKYPNVAPLLYIPNSTHQGNMSTVKVIPSTNIGLQRTAPVRVSTVASAMPHNSTFLTQNSNRSLLSRPPNPLAALAANNKNNQTIVVANSTGVIRSVPAAVVMGSGSHKKQIFTLSNSMQANVGGQVSLLDPKNLKCIGTLYKTKKVNEGSSEAANVLPEQNVVIMSATGSTPINPTSPYIVPKTLKQTPQGIVYTPFPQGKRMQVVLTTEGGLQSKSSITLSQAGTFPVTSVTSVTSSGPKQDNLIANHIESQITTSNFQEVSLSEDLDEEAGPCPDLIPIAKSEITGQESNPKSKGKYLIPITPTVTTYKNVQSPVIVPIKIKNPEEGSRLQGTSLNQIVSTNPAGTVTNFQISNGQIVSEKVTKPRMLSLLYDSYGFEMVQPKSGENSPESVTAFEPTITKDIQVTKKIEEAKIVKPEPTVVKHRRKQELEVKDDTIRPVIKSVDDSGESDLKILKHYIDDSNQFSFSGNSFESDGNGDSANKAETDDVKEEENKAIHREMSGSGYTDDGPDTDEEKFDPIKCLEWSDNVGTLPFSDLKFRLNEFGLIEVIDEDEEEGKVSSKSSIVSDIEKTERRRKKARNSDEMLCCQSCGTYGMVCEFVSSRFCSAACSQAYAEEKAQSVKKLLEKQEKKMKLKQQKFMLLQQRAKLERLGLHEAKVTIEERIKMLRMERELMKTNTGDSDCESGSGMSSNADRVRASSRGSFSWGRYLTMVKAKSAPYTLFKDPFPTNRNNFKIGMKLEGIDPIHPSLFCVLTVSAVLGYRIKLHFDGYPDCHDFWVNANSSDIFHAGWCERTNHKLSAPKGYAEKNFNWGNYLRMTRTAAAPKSCFVNNQEKTIIPSGFRVGMKLEAVDKKNSSLVCVATITDVLDNRILVHFDSWDDIYDYWVDSTSPYIHPVGWCKENGHQLTPPNDYKTPATFSWDVYLRETKSLPAPARAFKPRTTTDFRRGMKLECVDKRNPILIRVATVIDVLAQQIKIKFDGWPDQYAYWVDDDSPDIHPAGWCQKTGHPLEPPPCEEDIKNTSVCPTPGCRGMGHVKGKHPFHHMVLSCPYSSMNYLRDDHVSDRFYSKREYYEVKETALSKGTKPRPGVPRKLRIDSSGSPKPESRGRKRKAERHPTVNIKKNKANSGTEENTDPGSENEPPLWSKNNWDISETVASIGENPLNWSPSQVALFVENINNSAEKGKLFSEQQIDGEALLMLSQSDLVKVLGFKLGPAIKLYKSIVLLRQKALEIKKSISS